MRFEEREEEVFFFGWEDEILEEVFGPGDFAEVLDVEENCSHVSYWFSKFERGEKRLTPLLSFEAVSSHKRDADKLLLIVQSFLLFFIGTSTLLHRVVSHRHHVVFVVVSMASWHWRRWWRRVSHSH